MSNKARTPFRSVLAYAPPGVSSFGLSAVSNIFAGRSNMGLPRLDVAVCADRAGTLQTDLGMCMRVEHGPEAMASADLIIVLPTDDRPLTLPAPVGRAITAAFLRGAIIAGYCSGSFLLAETGLLDGRRATTSRHLSARLARHHPAISVEGDALYVDEGQVVTAAGGIAGIDMCLHLLRREHGAAVSNAVAREWMIASHRESGQTPYGPSSSEAGTPSYADSENARLADLLVWARTRLRQPMTVSDLAKQALMSPRTFARRFRAATGTTPHAWLSGQRLDRAEELLATTDLSIEQIAAQIGFHAGRVLRAQFAKRHGVSPSAFRQSRRAPVREREAR